MDPSAAAAASRLSRVTQPPSDERVADYFSVVEPSPESLRGLLEASQRSTVFAVPLRPSVVHVFPIVPWRDYPLPRDYIAKLCFPGDMYLKPTARPEVSFNFVVVDNDRRIYNSCLIFYEEYAVHASPITPPQTLLDADAQPQPQPQPQPPPTRCYKPKALCITSHRPFFETFQAFLINLLELAKTKGRKQIQTCIANFILGIPLPPAGEKDVRYQIHPGFPSLTIKQPVLNRPQYPEISCYRMFAWLPTEQIVECFLSVITEKKLIIHSSCYGIMTEIAQSLVSFMFPFKWYHTFLPIIHNDFITLIQSPAPYIIGVNNTVELPWDEIEECLVLYVEKKRIYYHFQTEKKYKEFSSDLIQRRLFRGLISDIERVKSKYRIPSNPHYSILKDVVKIAGTNSMVSSYTHMNHLTPEEHSLFTDEIRLVFFNFIVSRFEEYRCFMVLDTKNPRNSRMDEESYLAIEKDRNRGFLYLALQSQGFRNYITECASRNDHPVSLIFDQTIQTLKKSFWAFKRQETEFLDTNIFDYKTSQHISNPPVLQDDIPRPPFPSLDPKEYPDVPFAQAIEAKMTNVSNFATLRPYLEKEKASRSQHMKELKERYGRKYDPASLTNEICCSNVRIHLSSRAPTLAIEVFGQFLSGPNSSTLTRELIELVAVAVNQCDSSTIAINIIENHRHGWVPIDAGFFESRLKPLERDVSKRKQVTIPIAYNFSDAKNEPSSHESCDFRAHPPNSIRFALMDPVPFDQFMPGVSLNLRADCPFCKETLNSAMVRSGWTSDPANFSTKCICGRSFNPQLSVTMPTNALNFSLSTSNSAAVMTIISQATMEIRHKTIRNSSQLNTVISQTTGLDMMTESQSSQHTTFNQFQNPEVSDQKADSNLGEMTSVPKARNSLSLSLHDHPDSAEYTCLSLPAVLARLDRFLITNTDRTISPPDFCKEDPELFWNVIFFAREWAYPMDALVYGMDWPMLYFQRRPSGMPDGL